MTSHYIYSAAVTTTRTRALDAAIELLGTEGLRALTHGRVDERAGVPKGSTSNHFRTRAALLGGVVDRVVEREMTDVSTAASSTASPEELVDSLCALLDQVTRRNRTLTTARLVLFMEASHDAGLRKALSPGRLTMEFAVVATLTRLGARDPQAGAGAVMACLEGLILHRISRHDDTDPRPTLGLVVRSALG